MDRRLASVVVAVSAVLSASACSGSSQTMTVDLVESRSTTVPGSSVTSSPATEISEVTTTTVPPPPDIRAIDFSNTTLPAGSCAGGGWTNPYPLPVVGGEGRSGSDVDGSTAEVYVSDPANFLDIDGDGYEDALLQVTCGAGGTAGEQFVLPLTTTTGTLTLLGGNIVPSALLDAEVEDSRIRGYRTDGMTVVVDEVIPVGDEPRCCFTGTRVVRWTFDNGAWSHSADAPPAAPAGLRLNGLTTDGVEPLAFGSSIDQAEQITGRKAVGCQMGGSVPGSYIEEALPGVTLSFDKSGTFVLWFAETPDASTPSGGRVGMTADALTELIPYAEYLDFYGRPAYVVRSEGNSIVFHIEDEIVTSIVAGRSGRVEDVGELC